MRAPKIYVYKDKMYTIKDLSAMLGVSRSKAYTLINKYTIDDLVNGNVTSRKYERAAEKNMKRCHAKSYKECLNCPYDECTRVSRLPDEPRARDYVSMTSGIEGAEDYDIKRVSS